MLGKFGKFLRILGYNTKIASPTLTDTQILEACIQEHRILLTKDKEFFSRMINSKYLDDSPCLALYIDESSLEKQLLFFLKNFHLNLDKLDSKKPEDFISRCSICNELVKRVKKEEIRKEINPGTYENHEQFWKCSNINCSNVFWVGSHWDNISKTINEVKRELRG